MNATTEAIEEAKQEEFVGQLQKAIEAFDDAYHTLVRLKTRWDDRLWSSGAFELSNSQCTSVKMSAQEVANGITMISQIKTAAESDDWAYNTTPFLTS